MISKRKPCEGSEIFGPFDGHEEEPSGNFVVAFVQSLADAASDGGGRRHGAV